MKEIKSVCSAVALVEPLGNTEKVFPSVPFHGIRLDQFVSGRHAANQALKKLGVVQEAFLPRSEEGYAVFPRGTVGSISHSAQLAVSVVAFSSDVRMLGIDIEPIQPIEDSALPYVAKSDEIHLVEKTYKTELAPLTIFVIKEAVFKALFPTHHVAIWFSHVTMLREITDGCYEVSVDSQDIGHPLLLRVHTGIFADHIYAIALAE